MLHDSYFSIHSSNFLKTASRIHTKHYKGIQRLSGGTYASPIEINDIYEKIGVEKGVILPSLSPENRHRFISNEEAVETVLEYPKLFDWFCNIDLRMGSNSKDADLSKFIMYYKELGAKGVGEITANMYFDDPMVLNLFYHCEKCNMSLTFHIGNKGGNYGLIDELGLFRLEKVLGMFPDLMFLGHSQKFWAEISADCNE